MFSTLWNTGFIDQFFFLADFYGPWGTAPHPPPPPLHWYLYSNQIWLTYRAIIFMVYYKSSITINRPIKTSYLCCTIARSKPSDGSALPKPAAALFNVTQYFSANRPRNRIMRSCIHAQAPCSGLLIWHYDLDYARFIRDWKYRKNKTCGYVQDNDVRTDVSVACQVSN